MKTIRTLAVLASLAALPLVAEAHGPSRQKVNLSVDVNASPAQVWAVISDFCAIETWHPAVAKCTGSGGNDVGATRVLSIGAADGPKIEEELLKYDAEGMSYKYKVTATDNSVLPVTTYAATISVTAGEGGASKVDWKGGFYRAYTNNDPPPELNDEAAVKAVTGIFEAGLAHIKELAEGGK